MPLFYQSQLLFLLILVPVLMALLALNGVIHWTGGILFAVLMLRIGEVLREMDRVRLAQHEAGEV